MGHLGESSYANLMFSNCTKTTPTRNTTTTTMHTNLVEKKVSANLVKYLWLKSSFFGQIGVKLNLQSINGRFHVKAPRKKVNVKHWIFF